MTDNSIILRSCTITSESTNEIEICTEQGKAFKPEKMQIHVVGSCDSAVKGFVEICNITVLGNPQLINFSGETRSNLRGHSTYFKNSKNVDFSVIGSSKGQGLVIVFSNPHVIDLKIYIKLEGIVIDDYERIGK